MVEDRPQRGNVDDMTQAQLEIYARELQQHFQEERRLRQELESRNQQLEQRLTELTALNQLFQRYLAERSAVTQAFKDMAEGLKQIADDSRRLLDRVQAQGILEMEDTLLGALLQGEAEDHDEEMTAKTD